MSLGPNFSELRELLPVLSALTLGGVIGALNRAAKAKPAPLWRAILEGVASVGVGIAGGGVLYSGLALVTGTHEIFAALAAGSVSAFFGDKMFRRLLDRMWGPDDAADRQ